MRASSLIRSYPIEIAIFLEVPLLLVLLLGEGLFRDDLTATLQFIPLTVVPHLLYISVHLLPSIAVWYTPYLCCAHPRKQASNSNTPVRCVEAIALTGEDIRYVTGVTRHRDIEGRSVPLAAVNHRVGCEQRSAKITRLGGSVARYHGRSRRELRRALA